MRGTINEEDEMALSPLVEEPEPSITVEEILESGNIKRSN
jgi:hypothetical protein